MNKSIFYFDAPQYPELNEDIECDVAVIGGGIAGVTAAYFLAQKGFKTAIFEANRIGQANTLNSSAMVTFAHDLIYDKLIKKHGESVAAEYLDGNKKAIRLIQQIIKKENIDCNFAGCNMFLFAKNNKELQDLKKEQEAYFSLYENFKIVSENLPINCLGALKIPNQGYFNPFKYVHGLTRAIINNGGRIFEKTRIIGEPDKKNLNYKNHKIKAKYFIVATHFPYLNSPGFYFLKMYQHRSYNLIFKSDVNIADNYEGVSEQGPEFRPVDREKKIFLCGDANYRCGEKIKNGFYHQVETKLKEEVKDAKILSKFSAEDCMTYDFLPIAQKYGIGLNNVFVISGFNKWGMTTSHMAAQFITEKILAIEENRAEKINNIFDRDYHSAFKSFKEGGKNIFKIIGEFFNILFGLDITKLSKIKNGTGAITKINGKRTGVYKDEKGKVYAVDAVCPHLGCGLKWNPDEKSWDCPCHGSRFDIHGEILDGPSNSKIKKDD